MTGGTAVNSRTNSCRTSQKEDGDDNADDADCFLSFDDHDDDDADGDNDDGDDGDGDDDDGDDDDADGFCKCSF